MSEISKQSQVVTLRQLSQDTAGVIQRLYESGEPAMLTRMGRPLAVIHPLPEGVESELVARAYEDLKKKPPHPATLLDQKYLVNRIRTAFRVWRKERKKVYPNENGRYGTELGWQAYLRKPRTWDDLKVPPRLEPN